MSEYDASRAAYAATRRPGPVVVLTFDPGEAEALWLVRDCRDGFLGAFWRRPERYLEPAVRPGISTFSEVDPEVLERALARLRNDLDSGAWRRLYGGLLSIEELDVGYRLIVAPGPAAVSEGS